MVLLVVDTEFEFALLGTKHDGLAVHASHHVEGRLGFATQGQFEQVILNTRLDGFAQRRLDLKEAIRRTEAFNALIGALGCVFSVPFSFRWSLFWLRS